MKKLAFCMVVMALGMVTFAGCAKDDKPVTTPATTGTTDTADEGSGDTGTTEEGTTEEPDSGTTEEGSGSTEEPAK